MPVKAAVQYVKICNLYGDGFYYIPGTNICLKLGGYVRAQFFGYYGQNATQTPFFGTNINNDRGTALGFNLNGVGSGSSDLTIRSRALITVDTRAQTDYGVLRLNAATDELELVARYDTVTTAAAVAASGWPLKLAAEVEVIAPPSASELAVLRDLHARTRAAHSRPARLPALQGDS